MRIAYSITLFWSAALLFWVELLFAKLVLPLLGGSPAVWTTCLMFYQGLLLLGYLYAHLTTRWFGVRRQAGLHLSLLALSLIALPIALPGGWTPDPERSPILWLIALLTVSLGALFVMLSSTAPLLQRWFSALEHPTSSDPYSLYAVSNLGSLVALLGFPIVIEPTLRLTQQSTAWSWGYGVFGVLTGICAVLLWQRGRTVGAALAPEERGSAPAGAWRSSPGRRRAERTEPSAPSRGSRIRAFDRLRWIALAFVPSSLLLGVTTFLTTDVAAVPLLWVVPLALYLLTFVIVFSRKRLLPHRTAVLFHALLVTALILLLYWEIEGEVGWVFPLHLLVFFVTALVLHGELANSRPAPQRLTEFYLCMSIGGALGGVFNALLAPILFNSVAEYQWMVVVACLLRPSRALKARRWTERGLAATAAVPALLLVVAAWYGIVAFADLRSLAFWVLSGLVALLVFLLRGNALRFAASLGAILVAGAILMEGDSNVLYADRTFFGTHGVSLEPDGPHHLLYHGTTVHGAQLLDDEHRRTPVTYYHPEGPAGQTFTGLGPGLEDRRIAVVGLGAGSLSCYAKPGQRWTFFEIDPTVEKIARDTRYFSYLEECRPDARIVLGDARLSLAREPHGHYALLVLDAFSSDAIPVHLLTREALALYLEVLAEGGVLLVHISNRYVVLEPVLAALAEDAGLVGLIQEYEPTAEAEARELAYPSDWVVLAREEADFGELLDDSRWRPLSRADAGRVWTDDFSNIFSALAW